MFSHLIAEAKSKHAYNLRPYVETHEIVAHIEGFSHIRSSYNHFPPIRIKTKPCLFILKNKHVSEMPDFSFMLRKHPVEAEEEPLPTEVEMEFSNHSNDEGLLYENLTQTPELIENLED